MSISQHQVYLYFLSYKSQYRSVNQVQVKYSTTCLYFFFINSSVSQPHLCNVCRTEHIRNNQVNPLTECLPIFPSQSGFIFSVKLSTLCSSLLSFLFHEISSYEFHFPNPCIATLVPLLTGRGSWGNSHFHEL